MVWMMPQFHPAWLMTKISTAAKTNRQPPIVRRRGLPLCRSQIQESQMIVVSDSSPLISLAAIGRLDLLQTIFKSLILPQAVYDEIIAEKDRPGAQEIAKASWD